MRKEFELTETQYQTLLDACKPTPLMYLSGGTPMHKSPQENANDAWDALGNDIGFIGVTVRPALGKSNRFFTAEIPNPVEISPGLIVETVGDILGDTPREFLEVEDPLEMPRIEGTPDDPALGIHFGMAEEDYHRLPCFSNSYLRAILASPTLFWSRSWMNSAREEKSADHLTLGKAYHAMILEGHQAYGSRFYPKPDASDFPDALRTADEIKQAIAARDHKPVTRIDVDGEEGKTRTAVKADHVAQLVRIDRSVQVWDDIIAKTERAAAGRTLIPADEDHRIRLAARMIAQDPQLAKAFRGGYPEVTLIWRDPRQGVLMKARVDYLKLMAVVDLKTFVNNRDRSVRRAITRAIGENGYCLQPAVYMQGVDEVRKLIRAHGASAIHIHGDAGDDDIAERQAWAMKWAGFEGHDRFLFVFQQKGSAPVTRGYYYPLSGTVHAIACSMVVDGTRRFRECTEIYGADVPWLDLAEIDDLDESEIPTWSLEI